MLHFFFYKCYAYYTIDLRIMIKVKYLSSNQFRIIVFTPKIWIYGNKLTDTVTKPGGLLPPRHGSVMVWGDNYQSEKQTWRPLLCCKYREMSSVKLNLYTHYKYANMSLMTQQWGFKIMNPDSSIFIWLCCLDKTHHSFCFLKCLNALSNVLLFVQTLRFYSA